MTRILPRSYIVRPKQEDLVVSVDFGQGEDLSVLTICRFDLNGHFKVLKSKYIGKASDFNDDEIEKFLEEIKNKEIKLWKV